MISFLDFRHSMPLSQMGNYQEHLKRLPPPLKEIETPPVRQHMFGNPFKIDKVRVGDMQVWIYEDEKFQVLF